MQSDWDLLERYAREHDQTAFAELASRHVDVVYGAARRMLRGPGKGEEDVVQAVFLLLSQKAGRISRRETLAGWLFRTTRYCCANIKREEIRRKLREREAGMRSDQMAAAAEDLCLVLDEALAALGRSERDAILARFLERKSAAETGAALGISAAAAEKRVQRGLEKLRGILGRKGFVVSASSVAAAMITEGAKAAPMGLAASAAGVTGAANVTAAGIAKGAAAMMKVAMMKVAAVVAAGVVMAACVGVTVHVTVNMTKGTETPAAAREISLDLGDGATLKLARIPAGKFLMGSPETEMGREEDETQHEVTISKPFYIGMTHVTVKQFAEFVKDSGYKTDAEKEGWSNGVEIEGGDLVYNPKVTGRSWRNASFDQGADHPVVQVSWHDAQAFCNWLAKKTGKTVRLPTEAQWEHACRAGATTAYPWGDSPDDGVAMANGRDQSLRSKWGSAPDVFDVDDGFAFTSPVGSFKANGFGLYDMIGDAAQWCQDWYGGYGAGAARDPSGAVTGDRRVVRGGSWNSAPAGCRSASRFPIAPGSQYDNVGFRVVVAATAGD